MKNLLLSLFVIVFLNSCSNGPSACDCAQMTVDGLTEVFQNLEMSEEEGKKFEEKLKKKLAPCEKNSETDAEFKKEFEECLKEKMNT